MDSSGPTSNGRERRKSQRKGQGSTDREGYGEGKWGEKDGRTIPALLSLYFEPAHNRYSSASVACSNVRLWKLDTQKEWRNTPWRLWDDLERFGVFGGQQRKQMSGFLTKLEYSRLTVPSVLWYCWLGGRKGIRPVKIEWWGVGLSGARCRLFAYGPADATAIPQTPSSLASFKSRLV